MLTYFYIHLHTPNRLRTLYALPSRHVGTYLRNAPVREKYTYAILHVKKTYSSVILLCATDYACMVKGTKWLKDKA